MWAKDFLKVKHAVVDDVVERPSLSRGEVGVHTFTPETGVQFLFEPSRHYCFFNDHSTTNFNPNHNDLLKNEQNLSNLNILLVAP